MSEKKNIIMVYAEGHCFIGETSAIGNGLLDKAARVDRIHVMTPQGPIPLAIMKKIGTMTLPIGKYPTVSVEPSIDEYVQYIELITGIKLEGGKIR